MSNLIKKNIIYLCHAEKKASGGGKIIYRHSEIINNLKNFSSEIVHIKKSKIAKWKNSILKRIDKIHKNSTGWQLNQIEVCKDFKFNWFKNKIKLKKNFIFDKKKDFVILPEIFAHLAKDLLIKNNISYAIFVQNGYALNSTNDENTLTKAYKKAKFILSYSNDITKCIKLRFPQIKKKIIRISYSLNIGKTDYKKKKNLITYMSRKLPHHSYLVVNYLKNYLPKKWMIVDLNNLTEKNTYNFLKRSKIFLAFSNLEGLPLPPAEAALAKNFVIGYTGEGGNEYWKKPIFVKVNSGEINKFVKKIIIKIGEINNNKKFPIIHHLNLKKNFSKNLEIKNLKKFLKFI